MTDLLETAIRRRDGMKAEIERLDRFIRLGEEMLVGVRRPASAPRREAAPQTVAPANMFSDNAFSEAVG